MYSPEADNSTQHTSVPRKIGSMLFKFWHRYSLEDSQQFAYWKSIGELLKIDGKVVDSDWIAKRQAALSVAPLYDQGLKDKDREELAYGRARLEDYCRHQGVLEDGRVVTHLPVYGTSRDELAKIGILTDNFSRGHVHESSDSNFTAILPDGWSMRPVYNPGENEPFRLGTINCERFAGVFDETDQRVVTVFYDSKSFPYGDDFRSRTQIKSLSAD